MEFQAQIQEQMKQELKLMAKKKLYFSISLMFASCHDNFSELTKAIKVMQDAMYQEECDCGECAKMAREVMPTLLKRHVSALRPIFCLVSALGDYEKALGEYPEFTKFLVKDQSNENIADLIEKTKSMMVEVQRIYDKIGKDIRHKAPDFTKTAFGDSFVRACDSVKLKGEK